MHCFAEIYHACVIMFYDIPDHSTSNMANIPYRKNLVIQCVKLRVEHAFQEKKHGFTPICHAFHPFLRVVGKISHG